MRRLIVLSGLAMLVGCAQETKTPMPWRLDSIPPHVTKSESSGTGKQMWYSPSVMCKGCHVHIYEQQVESMHAKAYENPIFQAQYYGEALPAAYGDSVLYKEAMSCIACHSPISYQMSGGELVTGKRVDPHMSGVTCDFCHRIRGHRGKEPENGNFIAWPGQEKYGPFRHSNRWHHVYLEFQTKSEFCAVCHESVNQRGVRVKPTFTEWRASPHAKKGIQCQDCHMNAKGYLIHHAAEYESGKAAIMTVGSAPERSKLYSHRFPGARTKTQIENAIPLSIETDGKAATAGQDLVITVRVDNERTGHKMPSGSIELRLLWLDLQAIVDDRQIDIPAPSAQDSHGYDVGGAVPGDRAALGKGFPTGKRVYRAVFLDDQGNQTHSMIEAATKIFDNRLDTAAVRVERYTWNVPADVKGEVRLVARLNYVPYPGSFGKRLWLPPAETILVSKTERTIAVSAPR